MVPESVSVPEPVLLSAPEPLMERPTLIARPESTSKTPPSLFRTTAIPEGIEAAAENRSVPPSKFKALVVPRAPVFDSCNVPALILVAPEYEFAAVRLRIP